MTLLSVWNVTVLYGKIYDILNIGNHCKDIIERLKKTTILKSVLREEKTKAEAEDNHSTLWVFKILHYRNFQMKTRTSTLYFRLFKKNIKQQSSFALPQRILVLVPEYKLVSSYFPTLWRNLP